jgi:hypothetical protein
MQAHREQHLPGCRLLLTIHHPGEQPERQQRQGSSMLKVLPAACLSHNDRESESKIIPQEIEIPFIKRRMHAMNTIYLPVDTATIGHSESFKFERRAINILKAYQYMSVIVRD